MICNDIIIITVVLSNEISREIIYHYALGLLYVFIYVVCVY